MTRHDPPIPSPSVMWHENFLNWLNLANPGRR
jgi:hypothetical protein